MYCSNCGNKIALGGKFCSDCGKAVDDVRPVIKAESSRGQTAIPGFGSLAERPKTGNWFTRLYKGRIRRKYWILGTIFWFVVFLVFTTIGALLLASVFPDADSGALTWFIVVVLVIFYYLVLSLSVRRLHDMNQTGWMILVFVIPLVNLIIFVYMLISEGTAATNNYGEPPPKNNGFFKSLLNQ